MIVVAVVVFDRFQNVKEWIRCWQMCQTTDAQLVIIHNYADQDQRQAFQDYCVATGTTYIPRENIGFDIGAFQDLCRGRLEGFPEYDYVLWCTDDALPMRKDLVKKYMDRMPGHHCVALEISKAVRPHIRTTGFCISREAAEKLQFQADPIRTKEECYRFEHRFPTGTFLQQMKAMRYGVTQVSTVNMSPLWDSGFKKYANREKEHYLMFPKPFQSDAKIAFICPVFNSYPEIISSLINQTHKHWHLFLIHDGPCSMNLKSIVEATGDSRITYIETPERQGNWGHGYRQEYLTKLKDSDFDYVVITNSDNHHTPTYCEYMLKGFTNGQVAVYHSQMIHSYVAWKIIECRLQQGYVDCAGVMVRKDVACSVGWRDVDAHSADWIYFEDIIKNHGANKFAKVEGCLLVHN
jgi:hypothetical protein